MVGDKIAGRKEDPEVRGYLECMLMIAIADGGLEDKEIDDLVVSVARHPKMAGLTDRDLNQILSGAYRDIAKQGIDARLRSLAQLLPSKPQRLDALGMALSVSTPDGDVEPQALHILRDVQRVFAVSDDEIERLMNQYR